MLPTRALVPSMQYTPMGCHRRSHALMTFTAWERPLLGIIVALKKICFLHPSTLHSFLPLQPLLSSPASLPGSMLPPPCSESLSSTSVPSFMLHLHPRLTPYMFSSMSLSLRSHFRLTPHASTLLPPHIILYLPGHPPSSSPSLRSSSPLLSGMPLRSRHLWHACGTRVARVPHRATSCQFVPHACGTLWHACGTRVARVWHACGTPMARPWHARDTPLARPPKSFVAAYTLLHHPHILSFSLLILPIPRLFILLHPPSSLLHHSDGFSFPLPLPLIPPHPPSPFSSPPSAASSGKPAREPRWP